MLNVIDEFTHECLAIRVARKLKAIDVMGLSGFLCEAGYPSCVHEALVEHDGELRLCLGPLARRAFPFRSGVVQDQI